MSNALTFEMPMEFRLKFMAVVGPDFPNAKRELFNDIVNEVDGVGLVTPILVVFISASIRKPLA